MTETSPCVLCVQRQQFHLLLEEFFSSFKETFFSLLSLSILFNSQDTTCTPLDFTHPVSRHWSTSKFWILVYLQVSSVHGVPKTSCYTTFVDRIRTSIICILFFNCSLIYLLYYYICKFTNTSFKTKDINTKEQNSFI